MPMSSVQRGCLAAWLSRAKRTRWTLGSLLPLPLHTYIHRYILYWYVVYCTYRHILWYPTYSTNLNSRTGPLSLSHLTASWACRYSNIPYPIHPHTYAVLHTTSHHLFCFLAQHTGQAGQHVPGQYQLGSVPWSVWPVWVVCVTWHISLPPLGLATHSITGWLLVPTELLIRERDIRPLSLSDAKIETYICTSDQALWPSCQIDDHVPVSSLADEPVDHPRIRLQTPPPLSSS